MTAYLTTALVTIKLGHASTQEVTQGEKYDIRDATDKRWAFKKGTAQYRREWVINLDLTPAGTAQTLQELAFDAHTNGPFKFYSCDAHAVNLFTPQEALFLGKDTTVQTVDGVYFPRALRGSSGWVELGRFPAEVGVPLAVRAYIAGSRAFLKATEIRSDGRDGNSYQEMYSGTGGVVEVNTRALRPGCIGWKVQVYNFDWVARPQARLGGSFLPEETFAPGLAAEKVVIRSTSSNLAGWDNNIPLFDNQIVITEVG